MTSLTAPCLRPLFIVLLALALGGCSILSQFDPPVAVRAMDTSEYMALKRGDILSSGKLSAATHEAIKVAGLDDGPCARLDKPSLACLQALSAVPGIDDERRLSALSELWVQQALAQAKTPASADAIPSPDAWLEAARHAYAYLFFTPRKPSDRAFEDRQTQVRDYYNLSVQAVASIMFAYRDATAQAIRSSGALAVGDWRIVPDLSAIRLSASLGSPQELIPASSLSFTGLRSLYRRDGFGAELVAVMGDGKTSPTTPTPPLDLEGDTPLAGATLHKPSRQAGWSEMPFPVITALLRFQGDTLEQILQTRDVTFAVYDPYEQDAVDLHGQHVSLAGNFTAGYGLWLARSDFATQSIRNLLGREHSLDRPHLYLMQRYDPDSRIILMIHGLASSPEAWVNVANEIMGDETLRQHYQIWQIYYPTNIPIVLNHVEIRQVVRDALQHFAPDGQAAAAHDMVLIGHSMGGVISRLMVSSSGDELLQQTLDQDRFDEAQRQRLSSRLAPLMQFEPMDEVERAIFIASPHQGTPFAGQRLSRWLAGLIRLPLTVMENFADIVQDVSATPSPDGKGNLRLPNSVDNLREDDHFIKAAAALPISPEVTYHSIVARTQAEGPLSDSDDGLVPYRSAHLPGAASEKVILSGHSVQENAAAILELRRILHEDLKAHTAAQAPAAGQPLPLED